MPLQPLVEYSVLLALVRGVGGVDRVQVLESLLLDFLGNTAAIVRKVLPFLRAQPLVPTASMLIERGEILQYQRLVRSCVVIPLNDAVCCGHIAADVVFGKLNQRIDVDARVLLLERVQFYQLLAQQWVEPVYLVVTLVQIDEIGVGPLREGLRVDAVAVVEIWLLLRIVDVYEVATVLDMAKVIRAVASNFIWNELRLSMEERQVHHETVACANVGLVRLPSALALTVSCWLGCL